MSDDFRFDDDLFDDDFDGDDDLGGGDAFDDFDDFDDFDNDADFEEGFDFPEDDIELDDLDDDEVPEGRSNRTFIVIALLLVLILILGFGFLIFSLLGGRGPSELDITRTAIADLNATTEAQLRATDVQATAFADLTATATLFTLTPSVTPSPTPSPTPEIDIQATNIALTSDAAAQIASTNAAATVAADATQAALTQVAQLPPDDDDDIDDDTDVTAPSLGAIQQTATALAELFTEQDVFATPEPGTDPIAPTPIVRPQDTLPDTGLFDDLAAGTPSTIFLVAFGLVGLIAIARFVRRRNR